MISKHSFIYIFSCSLPSFKIRKWMNGPHTWFAKEFTLFQQKTFFLSELWDMGSKFSLVAAGSLHGKNGGLRWGSKCPGKTAEKPARLKYHACIPPCPIPSWKMSVLSVLENDRQWKVDYEMHRAYNVYQTFQKLCTRYSSKLFDASSLRFT